jgi:hypothetical protein
MKYTKPIPVICPHCKTMTNFMPRDNEIDLSYPQRFVVTCEGENGGCGNYFVVMIRLIPEVFSATINPPTVHLTENNKQF